MSAPLSDKPFGQLQALIDRKRLRLETARAPSDRPAAGDAPDPGGPEDDVALFRAAMSGVVPLKGRNRRISGRRTPVAVQPAALEEEDRQALEGLKALLDEGTGFDWTCTDEYVEHTGSRVHPEVARQLHEGRFTVQAHIDLHGLSVTEAKSAVDGFLRDALQTRKCAVTIIHGRGLSSPGQPVLKTALVKWLNSSPWRRWVAAFASARGCDGGVGAMYVLLRPTPANWRRRRVSRRLSTQPTNPGSRPSGNTRPSGFGS